jgi:hypothetical protein
MRFVCGHSKLCPHGSLKYRNRKKLLPIALDGIQAGLKW